MLTSVELHFWIPVLVTVNCFEGHRGSKRKVKLQMAFSQEVCIQPSSNSVWLFHSWAKSHTNAFVTLACDVVFVNLAKNLNENL